LIARQFWQLTDEIGPMTELTDDFGSTLRSARERAGVSLHQIADVTKLSVRNLRALESNRIDQLPGGIYRRAIVRAFASQVGLDPEKTLRQFLVRYPDDVPTWADLVPARPQGSPQRIWHAFVNVLGATIPILVGLGYFGISSAWNASPQVEMRGPEVIQASMIPTALPSRRSVDALAMMVSVSSPTVLQVVADGREIVAGPVDAGEVIRLTLASDVVLVGTNAGAVHFSINGRAGRTLGDAGTPLTVRIALADYQQWLMPPQ
jgi:transcriptional regulator with XRE-family HTH domain